MKKKSRLQKRTKKKHSTTKSIMNIRPERHMGHFKWHMQQRNEQLLLLKQAAIEENKQTPTPTTEVDSSKTLLKEEEWFFGITDPQVVRSCKILTQALKVCLEVNCNVCLEVHCNVCLEVVRLEANRNAQDLSHPKTLDQVDAWLATYQVSVPQTWAVPQKKKPIACRPSVSHAAR